MQQAEASARYALKKPSNFGLFFSQSINMAYYTIFSGSAKDQSDLFLTESGPDMLSKFWNMMDDNPYIKFFYKKILPSIKLKKVIYVPKLLQPLTIEDLVHDVVKANQDVNPNFLLNQRKYSPE